MEESTPKTIRLTEQHFTCGVENGMTRFRRSLDFMGNHSEFREFSSFPPHFPTTHDLVCSNDYPNAQDLRTNLHGFTVSRHFFH